MRRSKRVRLSRWTLAGLLVFSLKLMAHSEVRSGPDEAYLREIGQWRAHRLEALQAEGGWLALVGLHWLQGGENRFGSDSSNDVVLPEGVPAFAGSIFLGENGRISVRAQEGVQLTLREKSLREQELRTDAGGEPDVLRLGELMLHVIKRGERYALRVRDPNSPVRRNFSGLDYFPVDPDYRVRADFVPYADPKEVAVPTVLGTTEMMPAPGYVRFSLQGRNLTLEPVVEEPGERRLFFIFKDKTNGQKTYPAGRFLYADWPEDGRVILDFNKAYSPPCAFTPYATCPLPPQQNWLPIPIEAGEKKYGKH